MILYSCSKSGELLPEQALTLSFQISDAPVISSRSLDYTQEERIDDINLWLYNTDYNYAQHFYLQNTLQFQTELKPGEYELFAVANIGTNVGGLPRSMMETIGSTFSSEADLTKNNRLIMATRQTVRPGAPATITLRRVVSRIDVNITVGGTTDPRTVVKFIRLCKSPATARLFTENRATPTSASTKYPDHTGYDARQTSTLVLPDREPARHGSVNYRTVEPQPAKRTRCRNLPADSYGQRLLWTLYGLYRVPGQE